MKCKKNNRTGENLKKNFCYESFQIYETHLIYFCDILFIIYKYITVNTNTTNNSFLLELIDKQSLTAVILQY